jgi:hypothetical protein
MARQRDDEARPHLAVRLEVHRTAVRAYELARNEQAKTQSSAMSALLTGPAAERLE